MLIKVSGSEAVGACAQEQSGAGGVRILLNIKGSPGYDSIMLGVGAGKRYSCFVGCVQRVCERDFFLFFEDSVLRRSTFV